MHSAVTSLPSLRPRTARLNCTATVRRLAATMVCVAEQCPRLAERSSTIAGPCHANASSGDATLLRYRTQPCIAQAMRAPPCLCITVRDRTVPLLNRAMPGHCSSLLYPANAPPCTATPMRNGTLPNRAAAILTKHCPCPTLLCIAHAGRFRAAPLLRVASPCYTEAGQYPALPSRCATHATMPPP